MRLSEKLAELAAGITLHMQPDGACVLNADDANFALVENKVRSNTRARIVTYGSKGTDVQIASMDGDARGPTSSFSSKGGASPIASGFPVRTWRPNSVAAWLQCGAAGLPLEKVLPRLAQMPSDGRRGAVFHIPWPAER